VAVAQGLVGVAQVVLAPAGVEVAAKAAPAVLASAVAEGAVAVGATTQEVLGVVEVLEAMEVEVVEAVELVQVLVVEDLVEVAHRSFLLQTVLLGLADRQRRKIGAAKLVHAQVR